MINNNEIPEESYESIQVFSNGEDNSAHVMYSKKKNPFDHVISANWSPNEHLRRNSKVIITPAKLYDDFSKWIKQHEPKIPGKIWSRKTQTYLSNNLRNQSNDNNVRITIF